MENMFGLVALTPPVFVAAVSFALTAAGFATFGYCVFRLIRAALRIRRLNREIRDIDRQLVELTKTSLERAQRRRAAAQAQALGRVLRGPGPGPGRPGPMN